MKGEEVRQWREDHNLTRPEMCKLVGPPLTVAKLAGIETGRDIRYDELSALQAAIGQSESRLQRTDSGVDLTPKTAKSDPAKWTMENPSYATKMDEVISTLKTASKARGRKAYVYTGESRFKKVEEWGEYKRGDAVRVRGINWEEHGKSNWEKGQFVFMAHVTNPTNGEEWIDVRGGFGGRMHYRSITVDRLAPMPRRRKRKSV